jgi:hypothetical protein
MLDWEDFFRTLQTVYSRRQVEDWRAQRHAVHLALMQGEFLGLIISGEKSIESRFTKNRVAPVGNVEAGDLVLFKQVGRELFAAAVVEKAKHGVLDDAAWAFVRRHADDIGIDEEYIEYKSDARYYVLVWVKDVYVIPPVRLEKRDRRAWVLLRDRIR